jgi:hypothetical protein
LIVVMLFALKPNTNNHLAQFHEDVLEFFKKAINASVFGDHLFSKELWKVLQKSQNTHVLFETVFVNLPTSKLGRQTLYDFLQSYNDVKSLCADPSLGLPLTRSNYTIIKALIFELFDHLWDSLTSIDEIAKQYGSIIVHYDEFFSNNCRPFNICPFCGIEKYKSAELQRSDYDHYLNKSAYPHLAINFRNLVPMADLCNKPPNKGAQDMLYDKDKKVKRKALYPFSKNPKLAIQVTCEHLFDSQKEKWKIVVKKNNGKTTQQIETWKTVFKIEERWTIEVKDNKTSWLINFTNYNKDNPPINRAQLRRSIKRYMLYLNGQAKQPAWFLEIAFWKYFHGMSLAQLDVLLNFIQDKIEFKYAA